MITLSPTLSRSDDSCWPLINACQDAIKAKQVEIDGGNAALSLSEARIKTLAEQRDSAESKLNAIWRNPWVDLGVGVLVGGFLFRR